MLIGQVGTVQVDVRAANIGTQLLFGGLFSADHQFVGGFPQSSCENHQNNTCPSQDGREDSIGNRARSDTSFVHRFLFFFFVAVSSYFQGLGWSYFYDDRKVLGAPVISVGALLGFGGLGWFLFG